MVMLMRIILFILYESGISIVSFSSAPDKQMFEQAYSTESVYDTNIPIYYRYYYCCDRIFVFAWCTNDGMTASSAVKFPILS